jgi:hypothetical protein
MKLFFTLWSILCFQLCWAQTAEQTIFYTRNLDAFVGTWEYTFATDTFRVVFRKGILSTGLYGETLIGGYRHVQNGALKGDYTSGIPAIFLRDDFDEEDSRITVMADNGCTRPEGVPDWLSLFFKDMGTVHTTVSGRIYMLSPTQIQWKLWEDEGVYEEELPGFSVPEDIIMTKISDEWRLPLEGNLPIPR